MTDVSRETSDKLIQFADLVRAWTKKINLVSKASLAELETRHIADSLQVAHAVDAPPSWCDIGSGGGFPGIVVAIAHPAIHVTLIESDKRKAAFLRHASRTLDLNTTVIADRIEVAEPVNAKVVSARALAPLVDLIGLALPHATPQAQFIFPKGAQHGQEIDSARLRYSFHIDARPSRTDNEGVILVLENIKRV